MRASLRKEEDAVAIGARKRVERIQRMVLPASTRRVAGVSARNAPERDRYGTPI